MKDKKKFYNMSIKERHEMLEREGIRREVLNNLTRELELEIADRMVENVIGKISLPLGLLRGLKLNGRTYNVPMAIEEPSVIAAANKASKMTLPSGFFGESEGNIMIGEIQIVDYDKKTKQILEKEYDKIDELGKNFASGMEKYGGGWRGFSFKEFKGIRKNHLVLYFYVDVRDAMGANTINTIAEELGKELERMGGGKTRLKIISNLSLRRKVKVTATWSKEVIKKDCEKSGINARDVIEGVMDAYELAILDRYRLTTNNKGVMNGIDAVAIATGQDWRAIEAGAHMYSAINNFKPLVSYHLDKEKNIKGEIELPLAVGIIGGATKTLGHAKASLEILKVSSAEELAMVMAAVGMANNFAAIYAMSKEGIQKGHMKLHAKNIAIMAGAKTTEEIDKVANEMINTGKINLEEARNILNRIR